MRATYLLPLGLAALLTACQATRQPPRAGQDVRPEQLTCPPGPIEFIILQLNDVYEISPLDGGRVGGMARVATVLQHLEAKNPNTIAVLSGDFLSPSLISSIRIDGVPIAGEQMVAAMNAAGIDYVTFGNHEFDVPIGSLQRRLAELRATVVSSNVKHRTVDGSLAPFVQIRGGQEVPIPGHVVHTFAASSCRELELGLIGLTLSFNLADYVHYDSLLEAGRRAYDAARAESDLVFAITHLKVHEDSTLARHIPELRFIMGGHEHEDTLATVGDVTIAKVDANAKTVYIHWVTYHPETGKVDVWSQLMPITEDIKPDLGVESIVRVWEAKVNDAVRSMGYDPEKPIAQFGVPYDGHEASVRTKPTNLGQAVACAMLHADSTAAFAFLNSGSIRVDDRLSGAITQRDVLRAVPFGGAIVHASISGTMLDSILHIGLVENIGEGGYLQVSPNVTRGDDGQVVINGAALERDRLYKVVLPKFLSDGRESNLEFLKGLVEYTELALTGVDNSQRNDLRDVVIQYLASKSERWEECGATARRQ